MGLQVKAQDTLRVMAYNILNYESNNGFEGRYLQMRTILSHVKPDIVICSEVVDGAGAQLLLTNAFNMAGIGTFARVTFVDGPDTDNMLFYNTAKVNFVSQNQIMTALRNITRYRMYHLITPTDTAWLNLFSCHLKASSGAANEAQRLAEVQDFCDFTDGLNANQNLILGGDFNLYGDWEPAYQWLTNSCVPWFYDPINREGSWNNNASFEDIHTQSTRTANEPDGGSTGGLDDRFDFMLTNYNVLSGQQRVKYIPGSYYAVGNDGNHLNDPINLMPNTAVPSSVAAALYTMSDHLPVVMDLAIGLEVGYSEYENNLNGTSITWINNGQFYFPAFLITSDQSQELKADIFDLTGKLMHTQTVFTSHGDTRFELKNLQLAKGEYLVRLTNESGSVSCKFLQF